jgi:GntR family transcriptional regulator, transcriptional repressor for pyruvate dehydrogenase complex
MSDDPSEFALNVTPLLRGKSAAERLVKQIIDLIRSGNLKAGDRLPSESQMAQAFQVSRPVVREALRGMAILGIVETRQGGRCFVTDLTVARLMAPLQFVVSLDETNLDSLHRARSMIEGSLVREAARNITDQALAKLDEMIAAGYDLTSDPLGFRMLDQEFHQTIYQSAGNPYLTIVAQSLYELGMEYRRIATESPGTIKRSATEHQAIVAALQARDEAAAVAAMDAHLASIHQTTIEAMRRSSGARRRHPRSK